MYTTLYKYIIWKEIYWRVSTEDINNGQTKKFLFHRFFFKSKNSGEILHCSVFNRSLNHTSIGRLWWSDVIPVGCKIKYPGLLADKVSANGFNSIVHVWSLYNCISSFLPIQFRTILKKCYLNFSFLEPTITDDLNYTHLLANAGSSLHFFMRIIPLLPVWQRNNCKALLEHFIFTTK